MAAVVGGGAIVSFLVEKVVAYVDTVIISAIVSFLVAKVVAYAGTVIINGLGNWQTNLEGEISKISRTLEFIQEVIKGDADFEAKWLGKVKDVAYDMEDALDDCMLGGLLGDGDQSPPAGATTLWLRRALDHLLRCARPAWAREIIMAERFKSIRERAEEIKKQVEMRCLYRGGATSQQSATIESRDRETTPLQHGSWPAVGREEIKAEIKEEVLRNAVQYSTGSSGRPTVSLISIRGAGGMGKTTLARDMFHDVEVQAAFDVKRWVFVGDNFDVSRLLRDIIGSDDDRIQQIKNLTNLQSALIDKIKVKRFFIILDDCWCTSYKQWEPVWTPLTYGGKGGVVVVTTRNLEVARAIPLGSSGYLEEHQLEGLSDEECSEIFERWAFEHKERKRYRHLEELCNQIVKKLKGIPLAATMMGRFLNKYLEDREMWFGIANDVGRLWTDEGDVADRVIELSYRHLPSHLKPCFAYCSIFPKGFLFEKGSLVHMWIAQGYVQAVRPHEKQLIEHKGKHYFDDLHQRSFFQHEDGDCYKMHDLVHDFAQKVFTEGCQMVTSCTTGECTPPEQVRHLRVLFDLERSEPSTISETLHKFKKLRTLILNISYYDGNNNAPHLLDVFAELKCIRVLELNFRNLKEFPDSTRHLKLLLYLDISQTNIGVLPEFICDLVNLQLLNLPSDQYELLLPEGMSKLVNLRHLQAHNEVVAGIKGIGKLTLLHGLEEFRVRKEIGWRIQELKDLNLLQQELAIRGLENVESKEEAELACLKDKVHLDGLTLAWNGLDLSESAAADSTTTVPAQHSEVLEGLCPLPPQLERLRISNNLGLGPPVWMMKGQDNLVKLKLDGCDWECLPSHLGLLRCLRELRLSGARKVKKIGPEFYGGGVDDHDGGSNFFPQLDWLTFTDMSSWEEWDVPPMIGDRVNLGSCGSRVRVLFPSLSRLHIDYCPKLATLSPVLRHLTALQEMTIKVCDELASLEQEEESIGGDGRWDFPSLVEVRIHSCPKLATLSPILRRSSAALKELRIYNCDGLTDLVVEDGGWVFPCLADLVISSCPKLTTLSPILRHSSAALRELWIIKCDGLTELVEVEDEGNIILGGDGGWDFPSLVKVRIESCPKLTTLSPILRHWSALRELWIHVCDGLTDLVVVEDEGNIILGGDAGWYFLPSLVELQISCCPKLTTLSPLVPRLPSLEGLEIRSCPVLTLPPTSSSISSWSPHSAAAWQLKYLGTDHHGLLMWILPHKLARLEKMVIGDCDLLCSFTPPMGEGLEHLLSLNELSITGCRNLRSLPSSMRNLPSLERLELERCPAIQCLPEEGLPSSLRWLNIWNCRLLRERCGPEGCDRPRIPDTTHVSLY